MGSYSNNSMCEMFIFFMNINIFRQLKLEIALEWKIEPNNSALQGYIYHAKYK